MTPLHTLSKRDLAKVTYAYLGAALWSSTDENDDPFDSNYAVCDFTQDAKTSAMRDCLVFMFLCDLGGFDLSPLSDDEVGHDLWLTRAGHGTGFWDRDALEEGKVGRRVSDIVNAGFPALDLYSTDDGTVHF